jgi:hypothetical protein
VGDQKWIAKVGDPDRPPANLGGGLDDLNSFRRSNPSCIGGQMVANGDT